MKKLAIITIHGVRWKTREDWQTRVGVFFKTVSPEVKVIHFRFGQLLAVFSWWLSLASFLKLPSWLRRYYLRGFSQFMQELREECPDYEFSILAHSFGGWIVEQAMQKDKNIRIKNLVFVHCPIAIFIERTLFWNWLETRRIGRLFAWSSHNDLVIKAVAQKPLGKNGYRGFIRHTHSKDRTRPAHKPYPLELYNIRTNENHFGVIDKLDHYGQTLWEQLSREPEPPKEPVGTDY
ncbi:MAG: hypothetical protein HQL20_08130 [Candidatus Omnitrophica bacterium]|nr:hypothetical protein [Candidatus Omnitrophota bacterium]